MMQYLRVFDLFQFHGLPLEIHSFEAVRLWECLVLPCCAIFGL